MHLIFVNEGFKTWKLRLRKNNQTNFWTYTHFQNYHAYANFFIECKKSMTIDFFYFTQKC